MDYMLFNSCQRHICYKIIQRLMEDNADVARKYVKIYCDTNQFPALPFCGPHPNPHGSRGLSKNYRLRFYPKLVRGICGIRHIPCACVACTSMLDQPWIYSIPSKKQAWYQHVTDCTYWPVLGSYNTWNIINLTPEPTHFGGFDEIHQVVLDSINDNIDSLVQ